jgi:hypothetical protein
MSDGLTALREIGESFLLSALEPEPIRFKAMDKAGASLVCAAIRRADGYKLARFRSPLNRNAFLLGCLDYTENRPEEHLIVGYGYRHGSTTKINSLHYAIGGTSSVGIPTVIAHAMLQYYEQDGVNELIIFHNHPGNLIRSLVNFPPLASSADRATLEQCSLNINYAIRQMLGGGRVLFYLGENGLVKRYILPRLIP